MQRKVYSIAGTPPAAPSFPPAGKDGGEKGRWVPLGAGFRALKNLPRSNPFRPSCSREGRSRASASQKKAGAGRVAGPYRTPANPYRPAKFDGKADLPQQFIRNYLQIRCTVTGGAYHSGSRRRLVGNGLDGTSLRCSRSLFSSEPVSSSFPPNRFAGFAGNLRCQQNKPLIMQSNAHDKGRLCFYR